MMYLVIRHCFTTITGLTEKSTVAGPMPKSKAISLRDKLNDQEVKGTPIPENEGKIISFSTVVSTASSQVPQASPPIHAHV